MKKILLFILMSLSVTAQVKKESAFQDIMVNRGFIATHSVRQYTADGSIWFFFQNSKYEHISDFESLQVASSIDEAIKVYEEMLNSLKMEAGYYTLSNGLEIRRQSNQVMLYSGNKATDGYTYINKAQMKKGIKKLSELKSN